MFKKILMWSMFAGVVGLLVFGAVVRTEAKTEVSSSRVDAGSGGRDSDSLGQGTGGGAQSQQDGQGAGRSAGGSRGSEYASGTGEEVYLAADEDHEFIQLVGTVSRLDSESLWIELDQAEPLEVTGRAYRFILESGFPISVGDQVELEGFFEDGEFEVSWILDQTAGEDLRVRDDAGRPLWSGAAVH